ncbi:MAG TPA: hypothetical protein VN955_02785 [Gemmatimonadales bacterium]|nr:hypothetical protein [Gemmatimonadales bacterium]
MTDHGDFVQPTPPSPSHSRWRALLGDAHFWIPVAVLLAGLLVLRWIA